MFGLVPMPAYATESGGDPGDSNGDTKNDDEPTETETETDPPAETIGDPDPGDSQVQSQ